MKKILLISLCIYAWINVNAQHRPISTRQHLRPNAKAVSIDALLTDGEKDKVPINANPALNYVTPIPSAKTFHSVTETTIGNTVYDLQTNCAILNRFIKHNDGTMSAAWNFAPIGSAAGFPARGTGYNYFDGTSWGPVPIARIQANNRAGSANICVTASGREFDISHSNTAPGMLLTSRPVKGIGAWTEDATALGGIGSDTWAKAIVGGANGETVHALWNANISGTNGQEFSVYYSRSTDGGLTWPVLRTILPNIDSTKYLGFGGDAYSIDTHGDSVAFVIGDFDTDLILVRSNDNGNTWSTTVIQPFFKAFYNDDVDSLPDLNGDGFSDRIEGTSGDAHVMFDNLGKIHVWWSNVLLQDNSAADQLSYFPNVIDGLLYWNDGFLPGQAPDTIAFAQDGLNQNGILDIPTSGIGGANGLGGYRGSITQMPSSGVDANNNIYVAYQSFCEDCDTTTFNIGYKHVYIIGSSDQGATWSYPIDVDQTPDLLYQENVYACIAKNVDANCIHVIYQRDAEPGIYLVSGSNGVSEIIYACVPSYDVLPFGIKDVKDSTAICLTQNSPNPSDGLTTIYYNIAANQSNVTFDVTDVLGNVVYNEDKGAVNAGNYNIVLNTEAFSSGVYFYSLTVNGQKETKKLMVK